MIIEDPGLAKARRGFYLYRSELKNLDLVGSDPQFFSSFRYTILFFLVNLMGYTEVS